MALAGEDALRASMRLIDALIARGLAGIVVSPGSRSTPLVLACARQASVPVRVVLDERSAAFTALGLAKATGRAAAAVCTSGTAAANFLPAAVEASMSDTPLVLLTADRPPGLRSSGANQTIDQRALYGVYARCLDADASVDWVALGVEAFDRAMGPAAGAIQVNVPFDEPLAPAGEVAREPVEVSPWEAPPPREPSPGDLAAVLDIVAVEHGVVVVGTMPARAPRVAELAEALGWPLLAEPTSDLQGLSACEPLVAGDPPRPEAVLQFGTTPTTRAMQSFVAAASRRIVVDAAGRRRDAGAHVARTIAADPDALAAAVLARATGRARGAWLQRWERADETTRAGLDAALDAQKHPSEQRVARDVAACVPDGATLVVGNSGPVRDLAVAMRPRAGLRVLANRGASGIDGVVSTVLGVAWSGVPTVGLVGDLTLLHDLGGLAWSARRELDAVLIVLDNGGGRIFDRLPVSSLPEHEAYFLTPHGLDLGALARAAGAGHTTVSRAPEVAPAVTDALARGGVQMIEVAIDGVSRA